MSSTLTINSNVSSLIAQRYLGDSTASLQTSFERLSSGLRINKASDDAAGLSIAANLNAASRVDTVGVRNANDAISFYSIAEGALNSLVTITTRLKELSEQSSNGVLSFTQRKSLDAEAQALGKEYQRIINTTQFNGQNIINSGNGPLNVQLGYSAVSLTGGNAPTGTFAAATTNATGSAPFALTTADLNGDGIVDLISADYTSGTLSVFLGNGNGTFKAKQTYAAGFQPTSVTAVDLNGDGIVDLVSSSYFTGGGIRVFLGNGNGTFKAAQSYSSPFDVGQGPRDVIAADLQGNGIVDLISADNSSPEIDVYLGNGDGTFKAEQTYATSLHPEAVTTADLNEDGIVDLISTDYNSGDVSVFLGNGDGTFKARQTYATGTNPLSVTTADLNGDGVVDIISADVSSGEVSVFLGNGDGTFKARQTYATGTDPYSVTTADLNGDGVVDIISADSGSGEVSVLLGNGDGTFKAKQTYATGTFPWAVTTADLNGDGTTDIISADYGSNQLSVFLGNTAAQAVVAPTTGTYSLLSRQSSLQALTQFTTVLNSLTASLGAVGANESRLGFANAVLQETRINYDSAASQIEDVDVASEAANLTKNQILQQAGAAVLAQANQQPALALRLLQGI